MEYRKELIEDAEKQGEDLFAESIRRMEGVYGQEGPRVEAVQAFDSLFRQWASMQDTVQAAACLGICYLHSDILMRTGNLRLTLYGEGFYLSEWREESTSHLPVFFDRYEEDMSVLTASLRKVHPRIYAYEIDAIRYHYAEYYYAAIAGLCRDLLEEIKESGGYKALCRTEDFYFFFGRWRGEAWKI